MSKLSIEKLNKFKKAKCLTNKKISQATNTPIVTIDRLFSGASKNPTITLLQKIAIVLECTVDDFIEYDGNLNESFLEKETIKIARQIQNNPPYKNLFMNLNGLDSSDIELISKIAEKFQKK